MVYQLDDFRKRDADFSERALPPQSIDAEEAVLGGILGNADSLDRVGLLKPEHFYMTAHQQIYQAILQLRLDDQQIDLISVSQALQGAGLLDKVGGNGRLAELLDSSVSSLNIDAHSDLIQAKFKRRTLISTCQDLMRMAHDSKTSWPDVIKHAEEKIFALADCANQKGLRVLSDVLTDEAARIERAAKCEEPPGMMTGFYDFDAMTKGMKPQSLIVVAGRPGSGKSAFAAAISKGAAVGGRPVAIFSLEMTDSEIAQRLLASESEIESNRLQVGEVSAQEWEPLGFAITRLAGLPVYIDESQDITPSTILSQCRALKTRVGDLGMVVIDYLHLMLDGSDDEVRELGRITRACKKMARALNVPVVLLSQLNRATESRNDKRPTLADLRGSGSIEQDSDMVVFLYRDDYYNPDSPDKGIAEIDIAKQRNGPTGTIKLLFEPQFSRFRNLGGRTNDQYTPKTFISSGRSLDLNGRPVTSLNVGQVAPTQNNSLAGASSAEFDSDEWEDID
jgi:replicative DNA helicase